MPAVVHHADIPAREVTEGDISFTRRRLGRAAGARRIGASHYLVGPTVRQMPLHVHGEEEEIFYVIGGEGIGYEHGAEPYTVAAGDAVVQRPNGPPHTFLSGDPGLELLAFDSGSDAGITYLPRAGVMWCGPHWVPLEAPHPFRAEALAGPLPRPDVDPRTPRPAHVVALHDCDTGTFPGAEVRALGRAGGAVRAGLNHVTLPPGARGAPAHCHTREEELFIVLEGAGTLTLGEDDHPLAPGDIVARPPSSAVAHAFTAGPGGLTYLAYGTHEPGDAVSYPELGQIRLRGLGVTLPIGSDQRRAPGR